MSSNDYLNSEIEKIYSSKEDSSLKAAKACAWIMASFKGTNLKILNCANINSLADFFILGSVSNKTQAQSTSKAIEKTLKPKLQIRSTEGESEGEWILIDLGDVIVHIFQENSREIFDLDSLWKNYPQVEIPEEYYFAAHRQPEVETKDDKFNNFF